jgi:hypothetical protein
VFVDAGLSLSLSSLVLLARESSDLISSVSCIASAEDIAAERQSFQKIVNSFTIYREVCIVSQPLTHSLAFTLTQQHNARFHLPHTSSILAMHPPHTISSSFFLFLSLSLLPFTSMGTRW